MGLLWIIGEGRKKIQQGNRGCVTGGGQEEREREGARRRDNMADIGRIRRVWDF